MNKRILSFATACAVALLAIPATVFASNDVAMVGNTGYTDLQTAFDNAAGGTVTMVADVDLTESVILDGVTAELDLNGHHIRFCDDNVPNWPTGTFPDGTPERIDITPILLTNNADLTITDSTSTKMGSIKAEVNTYDTYAFTVDLFNGSNLTVESGNLIADSVYNNPNTNAIHTNPDTTVTLYGGSFRATNGDTASAYNGPCFAIMANGELDMYGGDVEADDIGIMVENIVALYGGTVKGGNTGIEVNGGNTLALDTNNGEVPSIGGGWQAIRVWDGCAFLEAAPDLSVENAGGCHFELGENAAPINVYNDPGSKVYSVRVPLQNFIFAVTSNSGLTLNRDNFVNVDNNGWEVLKNASGSLYMGICDHANVDADMICLGCGRTQVLEASINGEPCYDLQQALNNLSNSGTTLEIKLEKDLDLDDPLFFYEISGTLDLNGKTVTASSDNIANVDQEITAFQFRECDLTITDSVGGGKVEAYNNDNRERLTAAVNLFGDWEQPALVDNRILIEGGEFYGYSTSDRDNAYGIFVCPGATLTITDGDFSAEGQHAEAVCANGTLNISGGSFTGNNAVVVYGEADIANCFLTGNRYIVYDDEGNETESNGGIGLFISQREDNTWDAKASVDATVDITSDIHGIHVHGGELVLNGEPTFTSERDDFCFYNDGFMTVTFDMSGDTFTIGYNDEGNTIFAKPAAGITLHPEYFTVSSGNGEIMKNSAGELWLGICGHTNIGADNVCSDCGETVTLLAILNGAPCYDLQHAFSVIAENNASAGIQLQ
ncbi:MAG: hypothetical protein IKM31_03920, partial [Oscillospiraceae bacterium]|nr:hypothetical protein [Oscillospiraceae bacterium]